MVIEHLHLLWMGIWRHTHTATTMDVSPDLGELAEILGNVSVQTMQPCAMIEAVEPFKLHPTSVSFIYMVLEHLHLLWMGIWLHTHTVTTTYLSQNLRELP